jgi:2-oxo-4-hydroxy-4-carboxy--5-ureidoimidazoline (OHCU) decarboxylase
MLPDLPDTELKTLLNTLFEPSSDLQTLALPTLRAIAFDSYAQMIDTIRDQLLTIAAEVIASGSEEDDEASKQARIPLHKILGAHPRLGEKKVESALSRLEQAQLQSADATKPAASAASEEGMSEADQLAKLNQEYEEKFPGLRYVVFVNGRGRQVIMEDMRERIARGDLAEEEKEAINVSSFLQPDMMHGCANVMFRPCATSPRTVQRRY